MVEIKTDRLLLRSYREGDAARVAEIADNKKIARNLTEVFPHPYTLESAEKWVKIASGEDKVDSHFVIEYDGEMIGTVSAAPRDGIREGTAVAGYWLGEDYWGKGFGTEAFRAVVDYTFEKLGVRRIEAGVFSWNAASGKILEKCGFVKEGCTRNSVIRFGEICDEWTYGLLREDWEAQKNG